MADKRRPFGFRWIARLCAWYFRRRGYRTDIIIQRVRPLLGEPILTLGRFLSKQEMAEELELARKSWSDETKTYRWVISWTVIAWKEKRF